MGTSKGKSMPTGGEWTPLKNEANKFIKDQGGKDNNNNPLPVSPRPVLGRYLSALGGADNVSSGGGHRGGTGGGGSGGGGGGGSGGGGGGVGRAAVNAGRALGGFFSGISTAGLTETLREIGLSHLIGKSAAEVKNGLLDAFADAASTLDEHAVREALLELNNELLEGADTFEEVDAALSEVVNEQGIAKTLADFFGKYLYRLFCRDFYEVWQKRIGETEAHQKLSDVKDYLFSAVKSKFVGPDTANKDWKGREGLRLSQKIMQKTLKIFEITP